MGHAINAARRVRDASSQDKGQNKTRYCCSRLEDSPSQPALPGFRSKALERVGELPVFQILADNLINLIFVEIFDAHLLLLLVVVVLENIIISAIPVSGVARRHSHHALECSSEFYTDYPLSITLRSGAV